MILAAVLLGLGLASAPGEPPAHPWRSASPAETVAGRFVPPPGFHRVAAAEGSFAGWLRALPLKPGRPAVRLYDGRLKANQEAHEAVLDIDVGPRDLQQCADAVIRLRAEYLRSAGRDDAICFEFTSGAPARWTAWRDGARPRFRGREVDWVASQPADAGYDAFRRYLDVVFTYAGSSSLARELKGVDVGSVEAGDVFLQGGFPGHAVIAVDVAEDGAGARAVLLAQSYMPAQDIHVLRNPEDSGSPWYRVRGDRPLVTPEWTFPPRSLRRFGETGCPRGSRR